MNNQKLMIFHLATILVFSLFSLTAQAKDNCSITCFEKTPQCFVSKDSTGCLVITDHKPSCSKGSCVCQLKSCKTKTIFEKSGPKTTAY